jgi:hypothetical protein
MSFGFMNAPRGFCRWIFDWFRPLELPAISYRKVYIIFKCRGKGSQNLVRKERVFNEGNIIYVKVEINVLLHLSTTPWRLIRKTPCNVDLGARWRWAVRFTIRPLYPPGKSPETHWMIRTLGGLQSRSGRRGEEKIYDLLPGIEPRSSRP